MSIRSSWVAPRGREAGRGLDEVRAGGLAQPARADLLVVGQVRVLEDDFDAQLAPRATTSTTARMSASTSASRPDLRAPIWMTMSISLRALIERALRLEDLGRGQVVAVRKADDRADHARSCP